MKTTRSTLILALILVYSLSHVQAQTPIWDIGTKWTYEFKPTTNKTAYVVNEIIDTVTIDQLKLYVVDSEPKATGIRYFFYQDDKVYNYTPANGILQLLYDFGDISPYATNYLPICDPFFPYDSLDYQTYSINIDRVYQFDMPDNTTRQKVHVSVNDPNLGVINQRSILWNIGFMEGGLHYTHDWEIGDFVCDEFANFVKDLRCFENDSVSYNFKSYACDSTWLVSSTIETSPYQRTELYPNPAHNEVKIKNFRKPQEYQIFDLNGRRTRSGKSVDGIITLTHRGLNIIRLKAQSGSWTYHRIFNNSR